MDDLFWYAIAAVDWASYPTLPASVGGPRNSVPAGLRRIDAAHDAVTSGESIAFMLDAVGRDESRRLFPVVLAAMPFLLQVAVEGSPWSRNAALHVVVETLNRAPEQAEPASFDIDKATLLRYVRPWRPRVELLEGSEQIGEVTGAGRDLLIALD